MDIVALRNKLASDNSIENIELRTVTGAIWLQRNGDALYSKWGNKFLSFEIKTKDEKQILLTDHSQDNAILQVYCDQTIAAGIQIETIFNYIKNDELKQNIKSDADELQAV